MADPRFVQIAVAACDEGGEMLYGLASDGRVYVRDYWHDDLGVFHSYWRLVPNDTPQEAQGD